MASLAFQIDPILSFLEGCGYVPQVARMRRTQAVLGSLLAWVAEYIKLDQAFFRALMQSLFVCVSGAAVVWGAVSYLYAVHSRFAHLVLNPLPFGMLLLTMILNHIVISKAIYIRAHKQEKLLVSSIMGAIFMFISSYALGRTYGALSLVVGYFIVTTLVGFVLSTFIFLKYRRIWHAE